MSSENKGYLYILDDDASFRDSLRHAFVSLGYQVWVFGSAQELLQFSNICWPAVLITDVRMPGKSGVELQQDLIEANLGIPLIFMSGESTVQEAILGMRQGAIDFLEKPFALEALLVSVERALELQRVNLAKTYRESVRTERLKRLAPREREACQLMTQGYANPRIAIEMGLSLDTVKQYKKNVYTKLGIGDLAALIAFMQD